MNQVGYFIGGPKRATLIRAAPEPTPFTVVDRKGVPVFEGQSRPWPVRPEPTSGQALHVLDFGPLAATGSRFQVVADGSTSVPFAIGDDLYGGLARDALRFFYLQRSGCPIDEDRAPGYGRPAGHPGDADLPTWPAPLYPEWVCRHRFDVSGGWYDAGDHGKYVVSGALPTWQLLRTVELVRRRGRDPAELIEECRWQLEWLLRMQVPPGHQYEGMAFHRVHGTTWAPLPMMPHRDPTWRVIHRPSTAATLALAAVAAQAARVLGEERLLVAARSAFRAARANPDLIAPDDHAAYGGGPYNDDCLDDDFAWAGTQLWLATGESGYRDELSFPGVPDLDGFDCARLTLPAWLDLAETDQRWQSEVVAVAERLLELAAAQPYGQPYAPAYGWDWGSNGRILNNLVVLAAAHELTGAERYRDAVRSGFDYLLGRNALGQSYITGYGTDFTERQRVRHFGYPLDPAFPPSPAGALAGGPTSLRYPDFPFDRRLDGPAPQCCYLDEPTSETTNDVCIRWNAPLVFIATFLSGE